MAFPLTIYVPPGLPGNIVFDQPDPTPNNHPAAWDLVLGDVAGMVPHVAMTALRADMQARDQLGEERYRTRLQPHNGRDSLLDAYHEALDLCVYLRVVLFELPAGAHFRERLQLREVYDSSLRNALQLRSLLTAREER